MKKTIILLLSGFFSCTSPSQQDERKQHEMQRRTVETGNKIQGDFDGDGQTEFAKVVKITTGQENSTAGETSDEYEIQFSTDKIKPMKTGCCDIRLINEGDLESDGTEEISIFQAPVNGCTYSLTTYSLKNKVWQKVVDTFLIPTGCDQVSDEDLQKRVFTEGHGIYYYDTDFNDENFKLIKRKAATK